MDSQVKEILSESKEEILDIDGFVIIEEQRKEISQKERDKRVRRFCEQFKKEVKIQSEAIQVLRQYKNDLNECIEKLQAIKVEQNCEKYELEEKLSKALEKLTVVSKEYESKRASIESLERESPYVLQCQFQEISDEITSLQSELNKNNAQIEELEKVLSEREATVKKLTKDLQSIQSKLKDVHVENGRLLKEIEDQNMPKKLQKKIIKTQAESNSSLRKVESIVVGLIGIGVWAATLLR